jgi:hypothetical protein
LPFILGSDTVIRMTLKLRPQTTNIVFAWMGAVVCLFFAVGKPSLIPPAITSLPRHLGETALWGATLVTLALLATESLPRIARLGLCVIMGALCTGVTMILIA